MTKIWKQNWPALISISIVSVVFLLTVLLANGTADEGDSIYHYLFARYAIDHPALFFHHWAKPFYVLVMCPFAQLGFIGAKLANALFSCISLWFTYLIARRLEYKWALAIFPIACMMRQFTVTTFSGLTEPLANMMLSISLYLLFQNRFFFTAIIISFLPFVRSEGLFIAGVFSLYFLWIRQWKYIPLLLLGHIVYSLAGYPYFHDLLWVFHKIPYARLESIYGKGTWLWFFEKMPDTIGLANCALLIAGILSILLSFIQALRKQQLSDIIRQRLFILALFIVFFSMHMTFWGLGIFASFGMIRVFTAIACVMTLICLSGLERIARVLEFWTSYYKAVTAALLTVAVMLTVIIHKHYTYEWANDFQLHADQICDNQAVDMVKSRYPDYKNYTLILQSAYIGQLLDVDIFDTLRVKDGDAYRDGAPYPHRSIIFWDDWYSAYEHQIPLTSFQGNPEFKELQTFQKDNPWGGTRTVVVFVKN